MFNYVKKSDEDLRGDVTSELKWDPSLNSNQIAVGTRDGVVTLSGIVPHFSEKAIAEKAAQRVAGTRIVVDKLEVNLGGDAERSDDDIGGAAIWALQWNYQVPCSVKVSVERGWITLRGEVEWEFQRNAARDAVSKLRGVYGVRNDITIKSKTEALDVKSRIEDALRRGANYGGRNIKVEVLGGKVILTGDVYSLSEIEDARVAAYSAAGVFWVENNLKLAA